MGKTERVNEKFVNWRDLDMCLTFSPKNGSTNFPATLCPGGFILLPLLLFSPSITKHMYSGLST